MPVIEHFSRLRVALCRLTMAPRLAPHGTVLGRLGRSWVGNAGRQEEAEAYATSLLASATALMPEQRLRLRQVLIQNRFIDGDFAAAEHLSRDALAE